MFSDSTIVVNATDLCGGKIVAQAKSTDSTDSLYFAAKDIDSSDNQASLYYLSGAPVFSLRRTGFNITTSSVATGANANTEYAHMAVGEEFFSV